MSSKQIPYFCIKIILISVGGNHGNRSGSNDNRINSKCCFILYMFFFGTKQKFRYKESPTILENMIQIIEYEAMEVIEYQRGKQTNRP